MSNQSPETITKYEVLFAIRTGVTVLIPKTAALDNGDKIPAKFKVSADNPRDVLIEANKPFILKNMKKEHVEASVSRGFIMFYEIEDEDVVRNTVANYQK